MAIDQLHIKVEALTVGMFVSRLDRPWSQTPFPLQGFYIRSNQDIQKLKALCATVYIDVTKGCGSLDPGLVVPAPVQRSSQTALGHGLSVAPHPPARDSAKRRPAGGAAAVLAKPDDGAYSTTVPLRMEAVRAEKIIMLVKGQLTLAIRQIAKGRPLDYSALYGSVEAMVDSVLRCPDAMTWLLRLRRKDRRSHDHSLRSALWAVQYARFVSMPKDEIATLCLGTLLKDVGKVRLPRELLRKPRRSAEEEHEYRQFVCHGVEMLRATNTIAAEVVDVVRYHCERLDGSGFPAGIAGTGVPLLARIAAIATVYDAVSNPHEALEPVAPSKAVSILYGMRGNAFQDDLVVTFIQAVGLYPSGTLVELNTGDLGVVLDQNPGSRLMPRVAVLRRWEESLNGEAVIIDLKAQAQSRRLLIESGRSDIAGVGRIAIARDLEPTGYDIDFEKISRGFLKGEGDHRSHDIKPGLLSRLKERLRG